jgi:hypothetical protein
MFIAREQELRNAVHRFTIVPKGLLPYRWKVPKFQSHDALFRKAIVFNPTV